MRSILVVAVIARTAVAEPVWKQGELVASDDMCALRDDGRVMCWGQNAYGTVGDGTRTPRPVPVLVPRVEHAVSLAAGPAGTCAVTADGHVWCWGAFDENLAPRQVAGVDHAVDAIVTGLVRCARHGDGRVTCWAGTNAPVEVPALGPARRLTGGSGFACSLHTDASVSCLTFDDKGAPRKATPVPEVHGAVQIATVFRTTCAVLPAGAVRCWMIDEERAMTVGTVAGLADAIDLVAGGSHVCAARRSGGATCFFASAAPAIPSEAVDGLRGFRALAMASSASCGVRATGERVCWGDDYGPLGRHQVRGAAATPIDIGIGDAVEIAVGHEQACARRRDGSVACWSRFVPTPGEPLVAPVPGLPHVDRIVAGAYFGCGTAAGVVRCWGTQSWTACRWWSEDNCQFERLERATRIDGLLGMPRAIALADPCAILDSSKVACIWGSAHDMRAVDITGIADARSASRLCAVDRAGVVKCWDRSTDTPVVRTMAMPAATEVVSSATHSCAIASERVSCWGKNTTGQLGDGTRRERAEPVAIAGLTGVVQLAAGDAFSCARTRSGLVWCWGSNVGGALGDGSGRDQLHPVQVVGVSDAIELRAAGQRACVRRASGRVACWGHFEADIGQVKLDAAVRVLEPDIIESPTNVGRAAPP
jgi:hypothetical protein